MSGSQHAFEIGSSRATENASCAAGMAVGERDSGALPLGLLYDFKVSRHCFVFL